MKTQKINNQAMSHDWQEAEDPAAWKNFLKLNAEFNINLNQDFNWAVFHKSLGKTTHVRLHHDDSGQPTAGYIAVVEEAKFYRFLAITGGPLIDWSNKTLVESVLNDWRRLGQKYNCHFVRFRPIAADASWIRRILADYGLRPSPIHLAVEVTGMLDLSLDDQALRQSMSGSLKRKIKKSQADSAIVLKTSKSSQDAQVFAEIHQDHARLKHYIPFPQARIKAQFEAYAKDDKVLIYTAWRDRQILASNMIFFCGQEASYYWGVSTPLGQRYSSAPLLHLAAIAEAKRRRLKFYNFWGIVGVDQVKHRYYGLSQFKRSFGIQEYRYVPTHDLPLKPVAYAAIHMFETARRRHRRL